MEEKSWLEISITCDGELAEAVSELLSRYIPDGVVIETTRIAFDAYTFNRPEGDLRVYGYLPVDEQLETTKQKILEGLWYLGRIQPIPEPVFRLIQEENWMETWKQHYKPVTTGNQLIILPAWYEAPETDRLPIRINPGLAFGTGTHPTTQLCLELLEDWMPKGERVFDIGCGSCILSIAAIRLGSSAVLAVDVDPQAIPSAKENLELNQIGSQITLSLGSVEEILNADFGPTHAPLVIANIIAPILIKLLDDGLATLVSPGGYLMLSGIMEDHLPMFEPALHKHNLNVVAKKQSGEWIAYILQTGK